MKKPKRNSIQWRGIISVRGLARLGCHFVSANCRPSEWLIRPLHAACSSMLGDTGGEGDIVSLPQPAKKKHYCSRCECEVPKNQIAFGVESAGVVYQLTPEEMRSLRGRKKDIVTGRLVPKDDPVLDAVGYSRTLYVVPNKGQDDEYARLFLVLDSQSCMVFLPRLTINSIEYVAVVTAVRFPDTIFGRNRGALVVRTLQNALALKDPFNVGAPIVAAFNEALSKAEIRRISRRIQPVDPRECIAPRVRNISRILKEKKKE